MQTAIGVWSVPIAQVVIHLLTFLINVLGTPVTFVVQVIGTLAAILVQAVSVSVTLTIPAGITRETVAVPPRRRRGGIALAKRRRLRLSQTCDSQQYPGNQQSCAATPRVVQVHMYLLMRIFSGMSEGNARKQRSFRVARTIDGISLLHHQQRR